MGEGRAIFLGENSVVCSHFGVTTATRLGVRGYENKIGNNSRKFLKLGEISQIWNKMLGTSTRQGYNLNL